MPEDIDIRKQFFKPIQLIAGAVIVVALLLVWLLPLSLAERYQMTIFLLAVGLYVLVVFHWLVPRYGFPPWVNYPVAITNVTAVACAYYLLQPYGVDMNMMFLLVIVITAIMAGLPVALFAALLAAAADALVTFWRSGLSSSWWAHEGLHLLVFLVAGYLTSFLVGILRRQTDQVARLHKAKQHQADQVSVLNQVALAVGSTIELDTLLDLVYQQLSRVISADTYYVTLYNPEEESLDMRILIDDGQRFPPAKVPMGKGLVSWVVQQRQPLLIRHLSQEMDALPVKPVIVGQQRHSESWLGVPIMSGNHLMGILAMASYKPFAFDDQAQTLLDNVAELVALALDNAYHHAQVEEQARRDSLTGVYNHGYLLSRLSEAVKMGRAEGKPVSLIMLDIDYFKNYNDAYGHVVGDEVLRLIVQAIQIHVKRTDVVGRWGGEEFAIALPATATVQAREVAERIRHTLAALPLVDRESQPIPKPTVSQGIATFPDHAANADQLVDIADRALYQAKEQGRDQVRVTGT